MEWFWLSRKGESGLDNIGMCHDGSEILDSEANQINLVKRKKGVDQSPRSQTRIIFTQ